MLVKHFFLHSFVFTIIIAESLYHDIVGIVDYVMHILLHHIVL